MKAASPRPGLEHEGLTAVTNTLCLLQVENHTIALRNRCRKSQKTRCDENEREFKFPAFVALFDDLESSNDELYEVTAVFERSIFVCP